MSAPQTIFALASGSGRAGVAVVRVSGPDAGACLDRLCGARPAPRVTKLSTLAEPERPPIDRALVLWFPAPHSFTGEDVAEFHTHGGRAVVEALMAALLHCPGVRLAEPGEFTRRAVHNGKMDLIEAEGLADLIDAETEAQRLQALRQMDGALSATFDTWRHDLIGLSARLEALIDFPDEDDVVQHLDQDLRPRLRHLAAALAAHLDDNRVGEKVRDGFGVALIGAPNAGKSSLLNALAAREAAIVSPIAGTTRDIVEVRLTLAGQIVWLADTAGLREAADQIEVEGVRRALARAEASDIRVLVLASDELATAPDLGLLREHDVLVVNKIDLIDDPTQALPLSLADACRARGIALCRVSTRTTEGSAPLRDLLAQRIGDLASRIESAPITRARHRAGLEAAGLALARADQNLSLAPELAAEDLRLAAQALGTLLGRIDVEDIFDQIFSTFCLGK